MFGKGKKVRRGGRLQQLFNAGADSFYDSLEDILVEADISPRIAFDITGELRGLKPKTAEELRASIRGALAGMIRTALFSPSEDDAGCWLFLGVNGVGKTTSLAKLAAYWSARGFDVILAAADTFRAAAVEQLELHAGKLGLRCIRQKTGGNPGAVIFDALESAKSRKGTLVMADSAGRMHTKSQLMQELQKINRIINSKIDPEQYKKLLVIDATTGQNAVQQAESFHEMLGIDGIILSKYDSMARGGLTLSISRQMELPFVFLGTGEDYNSIEPFDRGIIVDRIMEKLDLQEAAWKR